MQTGLSGNSTSSPPFPIIQVCVVVPFFSIFLFCIVLMLYIFASNRHFMDSTRYILFAFMLVNDTLVMLFSVLLVFLVAAKARFPIVFCAPLLFFSTASFLNTPLILATMSLERYVAIMYPLQCPPAWRSDRVWIILLCLWLISCVLPTVDFSIAGARPGLDVLSTPILLETKKMRQDRASVNKAMHTVLLHGFQLLLCLLAFTNPISEQLLVLHANWVPEDIYFFNYFCFILIPRFLSPLIYGWRDKSLRDHMRRAALCCSCGFRTRDTEKPLS
uniref:G-protein coupled receptors family 1 profile domain-containing protein n=1 Tax=Gadus morhua TaxID=8049 RepID=A0A8C5C769_GADMO